ncbi:hypothetical protein N9516_02890 [Gammaproteobacteria bacterium]|nr:hypothetical protein [Gammaproteobacteria bacterium]MDC3380571.1 hypothetical protein [Gammaproteobacteria bacterium]
MNKLLTLLLLSPLAFAEPATLYECAQKLGSHEEITKCINTLPDEVKGAVLKHALANQPSKPESGTWAEMPFEISPEMMEISAKIREEKLGQEKSDKEKLEQQTAYREARAKQAAAKREEQKAKILAGLKQRCEEYGFAGDVNISACIQREAQHDKELAMQKQELRETRVALQQAQSQAQSRAYAQSLPPVVEEEEDIPFLIKFLGDVATGVAEAYADPAFHRDVQQQKQINQLKANQKRCVHNC